MATTDPLNRTTSLTYDSAGNVAVSRPRVRRMILSDSVADYPPNPALARHRELISAPIGSNFCDSASVFSLAGSIRTDLFPIYRTLVPGFALRPLRFTPHPLY